MAEVSTAQRALAWLRRAVALLGAGALAWALRLLVKQRLLVRRFLSRNKHMRPADTDFGLFGFLPVVARNWARIYDWKRERAERTGKTSALLGPFWEPRIVMSTADPRNVEHILKSEFNNYLKGDKFNSMLRPLLGHGIFVAEHGPHADDKGDSWMFQRKTSCKIFTRNVFQGRMYHTFSDNAVKIAERLEKVGGTEAVDMQKVFFKFTMDSIGSIGFGVDLNTLDQEANHEFADAFNKAQTLVARRFLLPFVETLGPIYSAERELARHVRVMDDFSFRVIRERLADPKLGSKGDILSYFISALRETGALGDDLRPDAVKDQMKLLRDVVMSFFIAGRDTTACALSFTFLLLANHPEAQERLYEEVQRELPGQPLPPTLAQLKEGFPYLRAVVSEALRLFPPVPTDGKQAMRDDVLPDGTWVPAGARVNFEPYIMGRSTEFWGPDAAEFRPERWLGPDGARPTPWEMPTFQPGPRQCLGMDLAKFEVQVLTVELCRRFTFKLDRAPVEPPYLPGITLTVNGGLPLICTPRPRAGAASA